MRLRDLSRPAVTIAILLALTEAVYFRVAFLTGGSLYGMDYSALHIRRIAFARDALFGPAHFLPAWYPRELLGAPFLANLQSFPWIPTRLVLLLVDPTAAYAVGVALAAALAALFTYLYCRRVGLCEIGAAAAAWTFACAGYFASRVLAGHLPLLEAYPSLPLLLWLSDRALAPDRSRYAARDLAWLALAAACTAAAGHPQVPAYSLAAAALYILVRGRKRDPLPAGSAEAGGGVGRGPGGPPHRVMAAMALGVATTLAMWWPALLLIQRSTRWLKLAEPDNDIEMPYHRLAALVRPGIDGWPEVMGLARQRVFDGYPNSAYFWDTCVYIGLLPVAVLMVLLLRCLVRRKMPGRPWAFLTLLGAGALFFSLPLTQPLFDWVPGTVFRSSARLLYLSTFSAAVALGFAVTAFLNSRWLTLRIRQSLVACCLLFHVLDLGGFARQFVQTVHEPATGTEAFDRILNRELKGGRIAASDAMAGFDDVGFFDSILLANPYRAILGAGGAASDLNAQSLDGTTLPVPALRLAGVRFVITGERRPDLELVGRSGSQFLYRVSNPVPRARFYAGDEVLFLPREQLLDEFLRRRSLDRLLLPVELAGPLAGGGGEPGAVKYSRPTSDEIHLEASSGRAGFVHVLESYDPGWSAVVDGRPGLVTIANGFSMAVPVEAGKHAIRLRYHTPGRIVGWGLSLLSVGLLAVLVGQAIVFRGLSTH